MVRMRTAASPVRFAIAALLALLLGSRLLVPTGFMPAFNGEAVTIVLCPDAAGPPMAMHHHGDHKSLHQPCPYAAASSLGTLGSDWAGALPLAVFVVALLLGSAFLAVERRVTGERPPAIGPPISG